MQALGSLVFTTFLFLWTIGYAAFFVIVGGFMSYRRRFALIEWYAERIFDVLRVTCKLDYRVEGLENIPDEPHIAYWKHSSAWETFGQFLVGPPKVIVFKHELIFIPFVGLGLRLLRSIAVKRGAGASAVNQVVSQGGSRLADGLSILIFPEGTRVAAGETRRYGVSGALLASRTGRKVVPVAHDAGYYWPRRGLIKKPGTVRVIVGPPIDTAGREPREINEEAQAWIETTIRRIRTEEHP
ncbi:MAG: 1-acyl-sn-glycerol-3-phosphate acyltransferase [Gammaproteobacteria bacterium]|nr:1-acyl-sn-glycerol-3-phosphate acyltransferase [Gammaproteobacteria bacterium]